MSAAASDRQAAAVLVGRLPRPHLRARRVRRGSSPPRRPDRDQDAAVHPRAAAIRHARRPSDRRNAWLCNSRSVGTRADLQRAPDDLLRFPFAAVAPTSCRTPSCTLTLVRSGQSSSPAARAIDRRTEQSDREPGRLLWSADDRRGRGGRAGTDGGSASRRSKSTLVPQGGT